MRHRSGRDIGEDTELLKLLQRCPVLQGTDGPLCRGYRLSYNNAAMDGTDIFQAVNQGEDSRNQFKRDIRNPDSLAAEMVAFSNTRGGRIIIGVDDDGTITGLSRADIQRLNQLISNTASQSVIPPVNPVSESIAVDGKVILVVELPRGLNKPYQDKNGIFWVKSGADKRKATSREEIQRLFQASGMIHADSDYFGGFTISDIDLPYFKEFFQKRYGEDLESRNLPIERIIDNMKLGHGGDLNLTGALLFARTPSPGLPAFIVKAVVFPGTSIASGSYLDSRNIEGKVSDIFRQTIGFFTTNLRHVQNGRHVNSLGELEIPRIVLEELLVNAIVHRDYFISSSIRIFIFSNRVEIISPGHLPNNLTVENIKAGNSNIRNPVLASFAYHILPYRGIGSGIVRALASYPAIEFVDDRDGNQFKCIIKRCEKKNR